MTWEEQLAEGLKYITEQASTEVAKPTFWNFKSIGKFLGLLKDKNQKILVMGCEGVGKTRFITSLYNNPTLQLAQVRHTKESKKFLIKLQDILPVTLIDTVGDYEEDEERKRVFLENMFDPHLAGIINVVSYGHHEVKNAQQTITDNKIFQDSRNTYLTREVSYLREWLPDLKLSSAKWVVTLVNKMDLWKPDMTEVWEHYNNPDEPYKQEFERIFKEQYFKKPHEVLTYSATMELGFGILPLHISYAEHLGIQYQTQQELIEILNRHS